MYETQSPMETRWYPWEIQRLVSTYSNCNPVCSSSRGGGCSVVVKTQSAKISLNFNFQRGGGISVVVKTESAKISLNFNFQRGGISVVVKTESAKISLNFNFWRGGVL